MATIDLNSDLGESFGTYKIGNDAEILSIVTSANIACGFHAGDPMVMHKTVNDALACGCAIGAHPGMPDLVGFGRRKLEISPDEAYAMVIYQVGALSAFIKAAKGKMQHVKPHGALYNMAAKDAPLAEAIAAAVYDIDPKLILYGLAGSELIKAGEAKGLKTASEVFADRSYQKDGSLTPRKLPGAMITDEEKSLQQVLGMVKEGMVKTLDGKIIPVKADTICVHGDGAKALAFSRKIKTALEESGISVSSFK
ncbi:MAG: LamB/YcsF family protein [Phascolarctobacterium sp.]|nr:LamB/YcsF family protein [Phascolarctobacterium sp.]